MRILPTEQNTQPKNGVEMGVDIFRIRQDI
jgi:hypothetical protein